MSIKVSIICLIYKSTKLLDAVYQSVLKYTPMFQKGEAELLFVANDATNEVLSHLIEKNYNFVSVKNTCYSEEELFKSGYGIPAYISNVYRGYNLGILQAKGEKIVLINSDNFFSDDWLENLLKYYDENKVISCQLVERAHEKFGVFPGAIEHYFGYNLDTFRDKDFNDFTKTIAREGLREGGAYMPSLLSKNTALKVGLYPTGNIANDQKENIKRFGDECFFDKLASIGVQHFTALDSISYHLKEGEREEVSEFDEKPIKIDLQKTNEKKEYPIIPYKEYENFFINNPDSLSETEIYNLIYQRKEPLVSIIIPVYNGANYMREAIDSALAQTYPNIEVIVVNDGSTDDTEKIALSYGDKIRYFSKENGGVATALNLAIQKSKGDYISWLSHDDVYYPNKIERQIKEIIVQKNPDLISYSDWITINEKSKTIGRMSLSENFPIYKLNIPLYPILNGIIHGCSLLIPKKCFDEIGLFDTNLETTQDYALWFKMFPNYQISYIPEALIKSRTHAEQGSRSIKTATTEADTLWINMIEQLSEKQIYLLEGSRLTFYNKTLTLLKNAHYDGAVSYLENKIANLKNELATENNIKISVIIPFYNRIGYTIQAIESVLTQNYQNFEIILVDDNSTEDISKIINYIQKDNRIFLYKNENKKGASGARNTGIYKASGKYIAFLDSDDLFLPEKLETQLKFMQENDIKISHTSYITFSDNDEILIDVGCNDFTFPEILSSFPMATPTIMIAKDIFDKFHFKFNENYDSGEDICLWIDIAKFFPIKGINSALTKVRKDGNNTTENPEKLLKGIANILAYVSTKENICWYLNHLCKLEWLLNILLKDLEKKYKFKLADNKLWRLFYKLTYRVYLKKRYGRKVVHEKYDKKYL